MKRLFSFLHPESGKARAVIGLDIGSNQIKLCQVEKGPIEVAVKSIGMARNPNFLKEQGADDREIIRTIKSLLVKNRFSALNAASSIKGNSVMVHFFQFPPLPSEELEGAVRLEAEQVIFTDLKELDTDFYVFPEQDKEDKKIRVLFVAAPKEIVDKQMAAIKGVGLVPMIMDIDTLALVNCFLQTEHLYDEESVILLDIGATHSNLAILERRRLKFIRDIDFGGNDLTDMIKDEMGMSFEDADDLKRQPKLWKERGLIIGNILRKGTSVLLKGIYRSVEYCQSRQAVGKLNRILLTGGTSKLTELGTFLSEILDIQTELWNPLANIGKGISRAQEKVEEFGPFLAIVLGLAMRSDIIK